jgi:hypothetical protein
MVFVLTAMFSVLLSLFAGETKGDTRYSYPSLNSQGRKKGGGASMHLATVKHHARIKAQQYSMRLYLIWETAMNARE